MFDQPKKSSSKTGVHVPQRPDEAQNAIRQSSLLEVTAPQVVAPRAIRWPPESHDYRRPQRLSSACKWLLIILALLLIFSGLALIIYSSSKQYGATLDKLETAREGATAAVIATTNASIQRTAQVIGTMQGNIEASATAVEAANNQAATTADNATAIANEFTNQYSQDTSGEATLENPLVRGKGLGGWDEGQNKKTKNGCTYRDGEYHITENGQGYLQPCIAEQTHFRDFLYQTTVTFNAGDQGEAGLLFRVNRANTSYYFFSISNTGSYQLELSTTLDGNKMLSEGESANLQSLQYPQNGPQEAESSLQPPNALQPQQISRGKQQTSHKFALGIIVQGQTYALFVNNNYVGNASDGSLAEGKIGVAVVDTNAPIDASFHFVQVWSL